MCIKNARNPIALAAASTTQSLLLSYTTNFHSTGKEQVLIIQNVGRVAAIMSLIGESILKSHSVHTLPARVTSIGRHETGTSEDIFQQMRTLMVPIASTGRKQAGIPGTFFKFTPCLRFHRLHGLFWRWARTLGLHQTQGHEDFSVSVLYATTIIFERPHKEYQKNQL